MVGIMNGNVVGEVGLRDGSRADGQRWELGDITDAGCGTCAGNDSLV
jgi:hypothetical protein